MERGRGLLGRLRRRQQKRYDDTDLLLSMFAEDGWEGELGKRALRRMNQIHGRFQIANDDFLYILSTLALEPIRWNERFGWRCWIERERVAQYHFWRQIGLRKAIRDIPGSVRRSYPDGYTIEQLGPPPPTYERRRRLQRHRLLTLTPSLGSIAERPMWSPRGRTIAFDTGNAIYEAVPDGSGVRRMTPTKLELDEIVVHV